MPGMGPSGGCIPFKRALAKIRGCGRFSLPATQEIFTFLHATPRAVAKFFCGSPIFTPCKRSWGMQISFFRSPNAPSSWMERFILRGIPRLFVTFPRNFSFFPECLLTNHLLGRILQQTIFSPAPGKKLAVGNVLTFLSPYSNISYGKKAGRYQGLEFCRRIITRVTEESMWQR